MNNVSPTNITLKYGAINGLATFALFIIIWFAGKNPLGNWSVPGWILPVIFTVLAVREHRDKDLSGFITYGRGLGTGMLVAIFSGFLFAVLMYAFITFVGKNIPQMQIDDFNANMEKLRASGFVSADKLDSVMQKFEESKSNFTAGNLSISSYEGRIVGGFIISLIVAAIYKKKPTPFETSQAVDHIDSNPS